MAAQVAARVEEVNVSGWAGAGRYAVMLHGVFSASECDELIERAERRGFEPALVNVGGGNEIKNTEFRNSDRCIIDDHDLSRKIRVAAVVHNDPRLLKASFRRVQDCADVSAVGLNERLRFLRYDEGNFFRPHFDGSYVRGHEAGDRAGERSLVTCQLYLNEGFVGGATRFVDPRSEGRGVDVVPRAGSVLLFEHALYHEGAELVSGRKYVIRTDVMYKQAEPAVVSATGPSATP